MGHGGARALAAGTLAAGLLMTGGTAAWADEGSATPTPGPITLTAAQSARVCNERIPAALRRIDGLTQRAGGDATVMGSTAWLQRRADDARTAGRSEQADRLQRRVDARPGLLEKLAGARSRVLAFRAEHCS